MTFLEIVSGSSFVIIIYRLRTWTNKTTSRLGKEISYSSTNRTGNCKISSSITPSRAQVCSKQSSRGPQSSYFLPGRIFLPLVTRDLRDGMFLPLQKFRLFLAFLNGTGRGFKRVVCTTEINHVLMFVRISLLCREQFVKVLHNYRNYSKFPRMVQWKKQIIVPESHIVY